MNILNEKPFLIFYPSIDRSGALTSNMLFRIRQCSLTLKILLESSQCNAILTHMNVLKYACYGATGSSKRKCYRLIVRHPSFFLVLNSTSRFNFSDIPVFLKPVVNSWKAPGRDSITGMGVQGVCR